MRLRPSASLPLALLLAPSAPLAAQFTVDDASIPSGSPGNLSTTENVDFADVDLDGDWDAALAEGGDSGNDQNRLWVNQGGAQGGTLGAFADETAARLPAVLDTSRDVEFADYDGDGDPDLFVANSSMTTNQPSRFWTNFGLEQGGSLGFYVDETAARWVGIGGPGSSVAPSLVWPFGGYIDWIHDGELGDLDNDGDLDLLQVSQGGAAGGQTPTRIFRNDGAGYFTEWNPSGFQLATSDISDGDPGLWCEGVQMHGTTDGTGAFCDVATVAEDADLGDVDGDLDLDILLGDRTYEPRMFANRLEASSLAPAGGVFPFRDVTGVVFQPTYVTGTGAFEQELGDMDGDHDLDILGVDWAMGGFSFDDKVLENDGTGRFPVETVLPSSSSDDNEGDLLDFDGDGDLDLYLANFSGADRLYRNESAGAGIVYVEEPLVDVPEIALDADAADLDGDGDPDVLVAHDNNTPNVLLRNDYDVADVHAPEVPRVEAVSPGVAAPGVLPVRAHVFDNAPYYVTYHADVELEVAVGGTLVPPLPMVSSGGQLFRGELPANLVGDVGYRVRATDDGGNAGESAPRAYVATGDAGTLYGAGSPGAAVTVASLTQTHAGAPSYLRASRSPGDLLFLGVALAKQAPPLAVPGLPGLVLNVASPVVVTSGAADANGDLVLAAAVPAGAAGVALFAQALSFDGATFESSAGLELAVLP